MISNEEIFEVLRTQGKELGDWLRDNYDIHTSIVITSSEVKIVQTEYLQPLKET